MIVTSRNWYINSSATTSIFTIIIFQFPNTTQAVHPSLKMPKVFFITGTSTGFGMHLVQKVLDEGDIAVATARKPESLKFTGTTEKVLSILLI
jgi:hypothetical protein